MRVALVHELLTMRGGAERVLRVLADMFPDAPIHTLLYDEKKLGDWFPKSRVRPSSLQPNFPLSTFNFPLNHHRYLSQFPAAVEALNLSPYDLVISSSSAFVHNVITNGKPRHLSYIHSPARYLWDRTHDVQERAGRGLLGPLRRAYLSRAFHKLRRWDAENAPRADKLLAASREVQRRIELYWRLPSDVLHPPIDDLWLQEHPASTAHDCDAPFLVVSTLAAYKRLDLAVQACTKASLPLCIVGEGPERKALEAMAGPTVTFAGYKDHDELLGLYSAARALIIPGEEDFGLAPLEVMACGKPVIAFGKGGVTETVEEGKTGAFFREQTPEALAATLKAFVPMQYQAEECRKSAARFSRRGFEDEMRRQVEGVMEMA
jgi:glycosyltransferase involved in cell wall biosynthesis